MHQGSHRDQAGADKLYTLIEKIEVAMMTTHDPDGSLVSRPMWNGDADENGDLWFFTRLHSPKTSTIGRDAHVNLAYADPKGQNYVSLSGKAEVVQDRATIDAKWQESLKTWFPSGKDDPEVALIRVCPDKGEFWDSPNSTLVHLYGYAKATLTGESPKTEAKKVDLG